jgi:hypothetical protein
LAKDRIFLDAGCINQSTPKAKTEGIRSMGGLLRMSRRMLVLWDVTYVERLGATGIDWHPAVMKLI